MKFRLRAQYLAYYEMFMSPCVILALICFIILFGLRWSGNEFQNKYRLWDETVAVMVTTTILIFFINFIFAMFLAQSTKPGVELHSVFRTAAAHSAFSTFQFCYFFLYFVFIGSKIWTLVILLAQGIPLVLIVRFTVEIEDSLTIGETTLLH